MTLDIDRPQLLGQLGPRAPLLWWPGTELTNKVVRVWFERAQRKAGIEVTGAIHRLRHTFCSMLAAEGATPMAIMKLAGHASIETTMKYMHLSPANRAAAIDLLDAAWTSRDFGETVEKVAVSGH